FPKHPNPARASVWRARYRTRPTPRRRLLLYTVALAPRLGDQIRLARPLRGESPVASSATDRHVGDAEGRCRDGRLQIQVVGDRVDSQQHLVEVPGNSHLAHGVGQLAVLDPKTR